MGDLSGQTFGSYRLEGLLGRGGMGEVYSARHLRLANRLAAVKLLPASLAAEPDFIRRFEHEANSAASLDHPGILPVWDYGEQDGQPYIAMPLVTGGSLKELLERRGPLAPSEAEAFLVPIAEALDYAHSRGILHRDVKPANILLRDDGRPQLADFGIAKAIEAGQSPGLTATGAGIGTAEYMAPEQIEGRAGPQSDLYSLGIALYQMLSGRLPYEGTTPYAIALAQLGTPLPPIRQFRPDLSPAVEAVLNRALAKDPGHRYGTGRELADAFRAANDRPGGLPAAAGPPRHEQHTTPLLVGQETRPLPVMPPAPPGPPFDAPSPGQHAQSAPIVAPVPQERDRPRTSWPLTVAALLIAALIIGVGAIGAFAAFADRPAPTATAQPPTLTAAPLLGATQTAAAANANANATATAAAIALFTPTVPPTPTPDNAGTATAAANVAASATTNAAATARTAASATSVSNANATATAEAGAVATASRVAGLTATAAARPSPTLPRTPTATAPPPSATPVPPTTTPVPPTPTVAPTAAPTVVPTIAPTAAPPPVGNWGPPLQALTGGKRYPDPDKRFSFSVPTNWVSGNAGTNEVAFAPPDNTANFSVALDRVPGNTTIEGYNQTTEQQLKARLNNYSLVNLDKVVIDNRQAYRRVARAEVQGQEIQFVQIFFLDKNVAHVLTFTCRPAIFGQLSRTFDGVAGSYKVGGE